MPEPSPTPLINFDDQTRRMIERFDATDDPSEQNAAQDAFIKRLQDIIKLFRRHVRHTQGKR